MRRTRDPAHRLTPPPPLPTPLWQPTAGASGKAYTAAFEEATTARVASLEAELVAERRRRRTLAYAKDVLARRVPQAETAAAVLDDVVATLGAGSGAGAGAGAGALESFEAFFAQASRLKDLCDRLAAVSPAAAAAISSSLAGVASATAAAGNDSGGGSGAVSGVGSGAGAGAGAGAGVGAGASSGAGAGIGAGAGAGAIAGGDSVAPDAPPLNVDDLLSGVEVPP